MEKKYVITISVIVILLLASLIYYSISRPTPEFTAAEKESLAKCLTQKGIYLYGTINCPNCEVQKKEFEEAVTEIVYVNCFIETKRCGKYSEQKVYPFWGMNTTTIVGPVPLAKLKEKTSC
ncbi:MAG: hypothetical protein WCI72_02495 [archaeon]